MIPLLFLDAFPGAGPFLSLPFRACAAAATSFLFLLLVGPVGIRRLRAFGLRERPDKSDSPALAAVWAKTDKGNTPTMGGLLVLGAVLASSLLWARLDGVHLVLALLTLLGFAAVGFADDWIKLTHPTRGGLSRTAKMAALTSAAGVVLLFYWKFAASTGRGPLLRLHFPFLEEAPADLPSLGLLGSVAFLALEWLVLVGAANAVNITDGMDGLAAGLTVFVSLALAALCYVAGRGDLAGALGLPHVPGVGELAVVGAALSGGCLGFLWFNCHPAQVFLGDTGSLAIGGLLGFLAIAARQELLLPLVAGVFFVEAGSALLQIGWFKLTGRRVLPIAPLHHIPQLRGTPEAKVVVRFWIAGALCALLGFATAEVR
ncbi:MAG TPA: phospho-N-acetylmuramoyl-pentapeptide-transferase [Planctomycetota bacterium]|jgi:phospho-N-acetylmuramoyl-pentapeptide-transferase|nr:phospho-N-acetylmuramoyl-pentapeptide-transferase [Planctomycetota bacterium]